MAQIGTLYTFSPNTVIRSSYFNSNFNDIKSVYNAHDTATTGVHGVGSSSIATSLMIPPIGSIIPFYDYNGALTFDAAYWAYCNGQSITVSGIGTQTLPDLSGRYLVGFGTDGGADIGSAPWATALVGNAGHSITLTAAQSGQKAVTVDSGGVDHSHTGYTGNDSPDHTHNFGWQNNGAVAGSNATAEVIPRGAAGWIATTGASARHTHAVQTYGASAYAHTHTIAGSDAASPTSIQPRSIRVRYIMRVQ